MSHVARSPFKPRARPTLLFSLAMGSLWAHAETMLEPVVVTATRTEKTLEDAPLRTEVVTRQEIERTNARTLKDALENVPGLQLREVHGKSGFEVSLQGLSSDQVLVLIDGLPITSSTGSTMDVSQYLLPTVDHIEVVKGAASAQYGSSAMGGVINIITRRAAPGLTGSAVADVGSYGSQNESGNAWRPGTQHAQALAEGGSETLRWRLAGDVLNDDGFAVDPDRWPLQGDAVRRQQYTAALNWLPGRALDFWVDAGTYRENDEQRYDVFAPPNRVPQRKTEDIVRNRVAGGGSWLLDNGVRALVKGVDESYDSESQEYSNGALVGSRFASQRMDHVTAQIDLPIWYSQLWQFGADWHRETLEQRNNGVAEIVGTGSAERSTSELFAQNDVLIGPDWELLLGLRWQDDSDFGGHYAPKLGLRGNLRLDADWTAVARAAFGQGYRVPNLKERHFLFDHSALGYMVIGNPNLKPESSNSFQLSGSFAYRDSLNFEVNAFYNDVRDLIQTDLLNAVIINGIAVYTYENVARARTSGIEAGATWRAGPTLLLTGAYTFTDAVDADTGQALTRRPRNMARLGVDWDIAPATQFVLRGRYQSSELVDSATGARSPGWTALDLTLNQQLGRGVTAFFGISNLFDRQRDFANPNDFGPVAGRYFNLGLRFAPGSS